MALDGAWADGVRMAKQAKGSSHTHTFLMLTAGGQSGGGKTAVQRNRVFVRESRWIALLTSLSKLTLVYVLLSQQHDSQPAQESRPQL
jgi:hypothetical protein